MSLNTDLDIIIESVGTLQRMLRQPEPPKPPAPPPAHLRPLPDRLQMHAFRLKQFHEVYQGHGDKERPIILKSDHLRSIDWMRREYSRRNQGASLATTEIVNACLDVIFSHPSVALVPIDRKEDLPQMIHEQMVKNLRKSEHHTWAQ